MGKRRVPVYSFSSLPGWWPSLIVAIAFALLLATLTAVNRRYVAAAEADADTVLHSYSVLADLNAVVARLVDAETGQRGFVITGADRYLDPYRSAVVDVDRRIDDLATLADDNPDQRRDIPLVRALATEKRQELEETIAARRREGFDAAQRIVLTDRGKETMDRLRAVTSRMAGREQALLDARRDRARRSSELARLVTFVSAGVALAAIALVWAGYRRVSIERLRAAAALAAERERLEAALEVKNEFLATVSHELRTPINAIVGWARMLHQRTLRPEKVDSAIASIDANAQTLAQLIDDLLESSRLLTGKVRLEADVLDLASVVVAAVDTLRLSAANKGVPIELDLAPVPAIRGDVDRLKQVLWNVIGNAVKFTPAGGRVTVRIGRIADAAADAVAITITDTGSGIAPSFLPHIFDPFRQGDDTVKSGLGLGLAITRQLVELHGGTIEARSEGLGRGSTFVIRLPADASGVAEVA